MGVAVESTYNWYWLVDGLQDEGMSVHLVNTDTRAMASANSTAIIDRARWGSQDAFNRTISARTVSRTFTVRSPQRARDQTKR